MFAYLDPASGSMILSVVAGGIAGIAVFFKSFGHRIWSAIAFWKKDDVESTDDADSGESSDDGASAVAADEPAETSS
jgi:NADH:ubiquinone oxidoreductase subunit 5 (subunit L)/multisubunit Na+/H+ antiporter MnhA subunit